MPDNGRNPEIGVLFPGLVSPDSSWLEYHCWPITDLDPSIVLHKPLPATDDDPDTLAEVNAYTATEASKQSVNVYSRSQGIDFVQRMSSSTYRVGLKGWALRAGYPIPIPGLVKFAGVDVVPDRPQRVEGPRMVANYGGIPVFFARWELWYHLPTPPKLRVPLLGPNNLALHLAGDQPMPKGIQGPISLPGSTAPPAVNLNTFFTTRR